MKIKHEAHNTKNSVFKNLCSQRYRICRTHLRSFALSVEGRAQRFCQQCGRFHDLEAFDGEKRNCRARLEQHNMRRRKVTDMNKRRYTEDDEREAYLVAQDRQRANTFHDQSTLAAETLAARFTANEQQQPIIVSLSLLLFKTNILHCLLFYIYIKQKNDNFFFFRLSCSTLFLA